MINAETHNHDDELAYKQGRADGIDAMVQAITNSEQALKFMCTDWTMELCDGNCDSCRNEFNDKINNIAEDMKGGTNNDR